jgi:hypothetical protein
MRTTVALAGVALLAAFLPLRAQEEPVNQVYRVEFKITDSSEASARSERHYSLLVEGSTKSVLKVGSRVPVATGSFQPAAGGGSASPAVNTQFQYIDIGVNIECRVRDAGGKAAIHGSIDISSVVQHTGPGTGTQPNPTLGQTKLELDATLDLGKATVIASVDDPVSMRQLAIQATVTKVD